MKSLIPECGSLFLQGRWHHVPDPLSVVAAHVYLSIGKSNNRSNCYLNRIYENEKEVINSI